jgi:hypothetical protein
MTLDLTPDTDTFVETQNNRFGVLALPLLGISMFLFVAGPLAYTLLTVFNVEATPIVVLLALASLCFSGAYILYGTFSGLAAVFFGTMRFVPQSARLHLFNSAIKSTGLIIWGLLTCLSIFFFATWTF